VGDSLNHGQYASLICMLHRTIPYGSKSFDSLSIFSLPCGRTQSSLVLDALFFASLFSSVIYGRIGSITRCACCVCDFILSSLCSFRF
jgi:hypothetical protein